MNGKHYTIFILIGSVSNGSSGFSPGGNHLGNSGPLSAIRPEEDVILALGTEALCDDLELKPDDFRILIFAWKCNAEQVITIRVFFPTTPKNS